MSHPLTCSYTYPTHSHAHTPKATPPTHTPTPPPPPTHTHTTCIYLHHSTLCVFLHVECAVDKRSQCTWSGRPQVSVNLLQEGVCNSSGRERERERERKKEGEGGREGVKPAQYHHKLATASVSMATAMHIIPSTLSTYKVTFAEYAVKWLPLATLEHPRPSGGICR